MPTIIRFRLSCFDFKNINRLRQNMTFKLLFVILSTYQFSTNLSTKRVRWEESKCLAAKRGLQGRAAKLLLCALGFSLFLSFFIRYHGRWSFFRLGANRFGYCRRRGLLAQKFNRRTNVEPCTNVQSKPFSPAFGNTLLPAVILVLSSQLLLLPLYPFRQMSHRLILFLSQSKCCLPDFL